MKKSTIITLVIVAGLMLSAIFFYRSCRADSKYKKLKEEYVGFRAVVESEKLEMSTRLERLSDEIAIKNNAIAGLESEVAAKTEELSETQAELAELQNAEPPTTPEVEALPIVISLRGQVAKLTEMFNLSQETVSLQKQEIAELFTKADLLGQAVAEWRGAYERETKLRVQAEDLFKLYEHKQKLNKFWKTTAVVATGAVAGLLLLK